MSLDVNDWGYWWCSFCGRRLEPEEVSYEETHDERAGGCGEPVDWVWDDEGEQRVEVRA